jgi:hypothetical protein
MQIPSGKTGPLYKGKPFKERIIKDVAGTNEENDPFTRISLR